MNDKIETNNNFRLPDNSWTKSVFWPKSTGLDYTACINEGRRKNGEILTMP